MEREFASAPQPNLPRTASFLGAIARREPVRAVVMARNLLATLRKQVGDQPEKALTAHGFQA